MKKYIKPMIAFEDFSLSTNIAAGCVNKANNQANFHSCGIEVLIVNQFGPQYVQLFTNKWQGCVDYPTTDDGEFNGYCYHIPTESTALFNS